MFWLIFIGGIMTSLTITARQEQQQSIGTETLVGSDLYPQQYWLALVAIAKNRPDAAKRIIEQIHETSSNNDQAIETIEQVFDQIFITLVSHDPQLLSSLGLFESIGIIKHNEYLTDLSLQGLLDTVHRKKECLLLLHQYPIDTLTSEHQVSYTIFDYLLTQAIAGEKFLFHEYYVNHLSGFLFDLVTTFTQYHRLENQEDAQHYCTRLTAIPAQCKQIIELQDHQKSLGIVPPVFTIERIIRCIESMIPAAVDDAILYKHLAQALATITASDKETMVSRARTIMATAVYPALQDLGQYYRSLLQNNHAHNGVWALPDGDEYYAYTLAYHTTTSLSPDEIYALGLQEVDRIQQEMRAIFARMLMNDDTKTVGQLMQELSKNPEFYYPSTPEGQQTCLADYATILERCRQELHPLFDRKPTQHVSIQAVPEHLQDDMPAAYYLEPSFDGSRPGTFFANVRNMQEVPRYGMETLVIHEAEPGHHFQLALQNELSIPSARKLGVYNAYVEGWALYTEKLAYEQGFYSSPAAQLGHLRDELLRAVRLVVDTGIHKKRWSKEHAIDYMVNTLGYHYDSVLTEVERYFVLPGQACGYKIGQLAILAMRDKAKQQLGNAFDIREFHNVVLGLAAAPLCVLEEVVNRYIMQKKSDQ